MEWRHLWLGSGDSAAGPDRPPGKGSEVYPLVNEDKIEIRRQAELFAEQGFSVTALAYKLNEVKISEYSNGSSEDNMVFVGLTADKKNS